jgi:hypothetical protein
LIFIPNNSLPFRENDEMGFSIPIVMQEFWIICISFRPYKRLYRCFARFRQVVRWDFSPEIQWRSTSTAAQTGVARNEAHLKELYERRTTWADMVRRKLRIQLKAPRLSIAKALADRLCHFFIFFPFFSA